MNGRRLTCSTPTGNLDGDRSVSHFATLTRDFGQAVQTTHAVATSAISGIAEAHRGASTKALQSGWSKLSAQHVDELVAGCHVLADALDVAAGYIVAQKAEALATLVGMVAAFVADQAASLATLGLTEAAVPAIIEGAEAIVKSLVQDLQQYVVGQVIEAAAKPLFAKVEDALSGLDWSESGAGNGAAGASMSVDAESTRCIRPRCARTRHPQSRRTRSIPLSPVARVRGESLDGIGDALPLR